MEEFSGPWLGIGILIGFFLGLGAAFVVARKLKSKQSVWEPERAYSRPSSATAHPLAVSSKMAIPEVRRDTDIMGDTRKSGILQAQQSVHAGVNEVVLNMPDAAPLRANTMGQNRDINIITAAAVAGAAASTHKRGVSTASVYDVDNLDDDWASLLASVDEMLVSLHHTAMTTNERPVAVRRLVAATSTRGMDGAVKAAVEEIIRFRSWNNTAAAHA